MSRDQRIVAVGAASGVAATIAVMAAIYLLWPTASNLADIGNRLA